MDVDFAKNATTAGDFGFGSNPISKKSVASAESAPRLNTQTAFNKQFLEENDDI